MTILGDKLCQLFNGFAVSQSRGRWRIMLCMANEYDITDQLLSRHDSLDGLFD